MLAPVCGFRPPNLLLPAGFSRRFFLQIVCLRVPSFWFAFSREFFWECACFRIPFFRFAISREFLWEDFFYKLLAPVCGFRPPALLLPAGFPNRIFLQIACVCLRVLPFRFAALCGFLRKGFFFSNCLRLFAGSALSVCFSPLVCPGRFLQIDCA